MSITTPLFKHHKHCDELFSRTEAFVANAEWLAADEAFDCLKADLNCHFGTEEDVLFPAFEQSTGMSAGPTQIMRMEHRQMRELLDEMQQALGERDAAAFSGATEILLVLMQQHNMKEENILYPMCDDAIDTVNLAGLGSEIEQRLTESCLA